MSDIPYGHCHCGCGELAPIARGTQRRRGWVKGQPTRFVHGHGRRGKRKKVEYQVDEATGCWVWQGRLNNAGYGMPSRAGRSVLAHRLMYERHNGPIPDGLQIDHLCRNPACVNPSHLEPVTAAENTRRGRSAKLTLDQVREIRASNAPGRELAAKYGVHAGHIRRIRRGLSWRHDEVAAVVLDMAERGDPTCLRLLTAMRDLEAQTGEYVVSEEQSE